MNKKICLGILAVMVILLFSGCQIPQYPDTQVSEDQEVDEITKELEELTKQIEAEREAGLEEDEEEEPEEMTEQEKAREEFKKKLLEEQQKLIEEADDEEVTITEEEDEVVAEEEEPAVEGEEVETEVETTASGKTINVKEGELVKLNLKATDPDGDKLTYTFTKPLDSEGKWQTKEGDAGKYTVKVSVSDGEFTISDTILIIVDALNHAPVLKTIADISIKEGEMVVINAVATDADGEAISYSYSGWMSASTKQTNYNDAGDYTVTVTASDGKLKDTQVVKVHVENVNRAPKIIW